MISLIAFLSLTACLSSPPNPTSPYDPQPIIPGSEQILAATPVLSENWTPTELEQLRELWLGSLPPPPVDPTNRVSDDWQAAALGHRLFFDPHLSANNQVACATCHIPELLFTDGRTTAHGTRPNPRHTISLFGVAYHSWILWDGRQDSLWSQALEPIENPDEQGSTRLHAVHLINQDTAYHASYEAIFGTLPDLSDFNRFPADGGPVPHPPYQQAWKSMTEADQEIVTQIYVNIGKAIAAYERLLLPGPTRFDTYIQAVLTGDTDLAQETMTAEEIAGLRLFIGQANCIRCHRGPLLTDFVFHNTGVPVGAVNPTDQGRSDGLLDYAHNPFNCSSSYADGDRENCKMAETEARPYTFKTPSLRNVTETAPYMHAGQLTTLADVIAHYQQAPPAPYGQSELTPLDLSKAELAALTTFLHTLAASPSTPAELLQPPESE